MRRQEYINSIRHWMGYLEPSLSSEDEREWANAGLLPPLTVLALEGDERSRDRIERILRRVIQTPPWDDKNHYFSALDRLGLEPHGGNTQMGLYLCNAVQHSEELGLPTELKETVLDIVRKMLARWARFSDHAKDAPAFAFLDQEGHTVNVGAVRAELIRKGIPEDFSYLREIGPKNQVCAEMRGSGVERLLYLYSFLQPLFSRAGVRLDASFQSCVGGRGACPAGHYALRVCVGAELCGDADAELSPDRHRVWNGTSPQWPG